MITARLLRAFTLITIFGLFSLSGARLSAQAVSTDSEGSAGKPPSYSDSMQPDNPVDTAGEMIVEEPELHVLISLSDQQMWVFEGDTIVQRFPVSTGVPGHRTPAGNYSVHNKALRAYSRRYERWMLHWMAITADGMYGMHGLEGTSYLRRLGSVASHGCIRLSRENAEWLYSRVEIGTRVEIVDDWDEPPEEKQTEYRVEQRYCL